MHAAVLEPVDRQVSKTCGLHGSCRFDSDPRHRKEISMRYEVYCNQCFVLAGTDIDESNLRSKNQKMELLEKISVTHRLETARPNEFGDLVTHGVRVVQEYVRRAWENQR